MTFRTPHFRCATLCLVGLLGSSSAFAQLSTNTAAPQLSETPDAPPAQTPALGSPNAAAEPAAPNVESASVVAPELAQGAPPEDSHANVLAPAPVHSSPAQVEEESWYGWQTLTADAISIAAVATGIGLETGYIGIPGVGAYLFAAPAVHWYRGAVGRGFISFGIRFTASALVVVGAPLVLRRR